MRFIIEDWLTDETIKVFDTKESREEWIKENVTIYSDGGYLDDGRKIAIYEEG